MGAKIQLANCGHTTASGRIVVDNHGYTSCVFCYDDDTEVALQASNRVVVRLKGHKVYSLSKAIVGSVTERVMNTGARTPTGGRYASDRLTVRDRFGNTWYGSISKLVTNKNDCQLTLRKAS
jgi:hypothetical protein